jgi:hypothetical protein
MVCDCCVVGSAQDIETAVEPREGGESLETQLEDDDTEWGTAADASDTANIHFGNSGGRNTGD